ncbi:MAG: hypothetical protein QG574_4759 [Cyanobacteriota bacterium erpe_2018_sw_21hr_WHONDRS-SW48-000092_B_bin.40]|jgi:hypothetical protein|nr:hypothetical protein [Cyanobacteriota bacterium erpe_2018_sw_21hr_WHONDRS-SW48-000092_B_bin.40]
MVKPVLFLSASPMKLTPRSVDLNSEEIQDLLLNPPNNRISGWNMNFPRRTMHATPNAITRGDEDYGTLTLMSNGYMELVIAVAESFFWPLDEEEYKKSPRFSPYAVCEFPVTFLRLYRLIVDLASLTGPFVVNLAYKNVEGTMLWAGHPNSIAYGSPFTKSVQISSNDVVLDPIKVPQSFEPDKVAHTLLADVYRVFGHKPECIPFYNDKTGIFVF